MDRKLLTIALAIVSILVYPNALSDKGTQKPQLLLAKHYSDDIDLADYWVSEKLDGFRGYFDSQRLWSRAGNAIDAPEWFTACFPEQRLDGEIWLARGQFQQLASIVKSGRTHPDWKNVSYQVFDLPEHPGSFDQRLAQLKSIFANLSHCPQIQFIEQKKFTSHRALDHELSRVEALGAEGLMLHKGSSFYQAGRSADLLKLKSFQDAEATVIGYTPGKGKYQGLVGALKVVDDKGLYFRLGSGLTERDRRQPPVIGSRVSYRFSGFTDSGLPRFARFLRVRQDL